MFSWDTLGFYLSDLTLNIGSYLTCVPPHFRESDYQDILNIDRDQHINDGMDYMPSHLALFLTDPNRKCYVMEKDGKVVSLGAAYNLCQNQMSWIGFG